MKADAHTRFEDARGRGEVCYLVPVGTPPRSSVYQIVGREAAEVFCKQLNQSPGPKTQYHVVDQVEVDAYKKSLLQSAAAVA